MRWEHTPRTVYPNDPPGTENALLWTMGQLGWEMCGVIDIVEGRKFYFKRPWPSEMENQETPNPDVSDVSESAERSS